MPVLDGKVVIITGASSGIGRSTARLLAENGSQTVLVARSAERLEKVRAELGQDALVIPVDVSETDAGERIVAATLERYGRIDTVIANAGVFLEGEVAVTDVDEIRRTIDVNVFAPLGLVRAALPHMLERGSGDIIITSSISGHHAIHSEPVYSASKHAVRAFAHALRQQIKGSGVRVGEVAPGMVLTELWGFEEGDPRAKERLEASRGILPEDVAESVLFMITRPKHVTIRDLVILPSAQDI
ncbi:SDR family oxidoreductase [Pseudarthrobacter sp. NPDC055928]|uniref:SDR family oxidoreductase n=1 Tax=Pseudarthrobacter sp. NPDC055928 TaxID=3345661 RepID=UPI0035DC5343